jgi:hypothetical protein
MLLIRFPSAGKSPRKIADRLARSRDRLASFPPATCTHKRVASFIVHFTEAKCNGQMRQMRVRIRPSRSVIILSDDAIANWQRRERIFSTRAASLRARPRFFLFFLFFLFFSRNVDLV